MIDKNLHDMFCGYYKIGSDKRMMGNMNKKEPLTLEEAEKLQNYAGRLKDNIIMVDFDDRDQSNSMWQYVQDNNIQCNVIQTTKGKHFYFKVDEELMKSIKATVNTLTPFGFRVDYKLGCKLAYSPLKIDKKYRKILKSVKTLDYIPLFLEPIRSIDKFKMITKSEGDFYGANEKLGRNSFLHSYIVYLLNIEEYEKSDIIDLFKLINKYVFSEALSGYEINTICRDESFDNVTNKYADLMFFGGKSGNTFLHNDFAKFIRKEHSVVKLDNVPQIYIDGMYYDSFDKFHGAMLRHIDRLKVSQRKEVMQYLADSLDTAEVREADPKYIRVDNGVYDTQAKCFRQVSDDLVFKNKINADYDTEIRCDIVDKFMKDFSCGDKEVEDLIWEMFGYCMDRKQRKKVMFFLYGPTAHNAKSTLLQMLSDFLGNENTSSIEPQDLGGQQGRFNKVLLYGKLANIVDDVDSGYIENTGIIKSMVDGRMVNADRKNLDPIRFKNYATFVFGGNAIPKTRDKTDGWMDRLVIIPCNAQFLPGSKELITNMDELITTDTARTYILNKSIEGYHRVHEIGFTEPSSVEVAKKAYKIESSTFLQFMDEVNIDLKETYLKEIYLSYRSWCIDSGVVTNATKAQIKSDILLHFKYEIGDLKRRNNETHRFFVKVRSEQLKILS